MKTQTTQRLACFWKSIAALSLALALVGCGRHSDPAVKSQSDRLARAIDPLSIILSPHSGDKRIDVEIRECQAQVRKNPESSLERLGWLFVAKARESFDPGFYKLAEQCAQALEAHQPGTAEALLLRGHALQSQHRFHEAEAPARKLVKQRGLAFDHGLLGDILVDVGRVDEAAAAYQTMLDLKPDPQGYARAAHLRWLKGDLDGALELMRMAARGATPRDPESAAWMHTQLARYLWQSQADAEAARALETALEFQNGYAPALLLRGRMLLAAAKVNDAIDLLTQASAANPLPEYRWVLADALRAGGREAEARAVEAQLARQGASSDPRTLSLHLATRRESLETAILLAQDELKERGDVFSHDAMAWALAATGRNAEAQRHISLALAHGTQDARLHLHAAIIVARVGRIEEARQWLAKASSAAAQLLPSELIQLRNAAAALGPAGLSQATVTVAPAP
jgi:Flp pilus assembly protein TadD